MKKKYTAIIVVLVIALMAIFIWIKSDKEDIGPDIFARDFYSWYTNYKGNALLTEAYLESELLTEDLKKQIKKQVDESKGLIGPDPFFCNLKKPDSYTIMNPIIDDKNAVVTISEYYNSELRSFKIDMVMESKKWLINNINCSESLN